MAAPETVHGAFAAVAAANARRAALRYCRDGRWHAMSFEVLARMVDACACALRALGVRAKDRVGIFSYNRPEWVIADLAALRAGAPVVPVAYNLTPSCIKDILDDASVKVLFVENRRLLQVFTGVRDRLRSLPLVVLFEGSGGGPGMSGECHDFAALLQQHGQAAFRDEESVSPDDPATIVYTSGTTGEPRGVVLTHRNLLSNIRSLIDRFGVSHRDSILSYLPLSHMFERTGGYYAMLFSTATISYAGDPLEAASLLPRIRPTILLVVPRVLEKAYAAALKKVESGSRARKRLVSAALHCLNVFANRRYRNERISPWLRLQRLFFDIVVGRRFRTVAGGRLRLLVSGGAPLDRQLAKTFYVLGFNIVEGYGTTETSPVISCNSVKGNTLGSVGRPLEGVEVRIADNDEILVRGPNVMAGYYNRREETAAAIDADGWFHTGDQGRFDERGNLVLTGRIKEIIITSYGKNIAPASPEGRIGRSTWVDQVMVYGDRQKFLVALIVPERSSVERHAREKGLPVLSYEELLRREEILLLYQRIVDEACADLPSYERVRKSALLAEGFTLDNGLLTPTLKLRRKKVAEKHEGIIRSLYESAPA
jgi:long-chain acyl-CoA synthetase